MRLANPLGYPLRNPMRVALMAFAAVLFSMRFLDLAAAGWIAEYLRGHSLGHRVADLPDLLLLVVIVLTTASWAAFGYLRWRAVQDTRCDFLRLTGSVLPLAFLVKTLLKWLFGRIETREWLLHPEAYGFHWFAGDEGFNGFPSGHMLVLTPLFLALWRFYPRYRTLYALVWSGLGLALVLTDYHFLSDVIAAAYIGLLVHLAAVRILRLPALSR